MFLASSARFQEQERTLAPSPVDAMGELDIFAASHWPKGFPAEIEWGEQLKHGSLLAGTLNPSKKGVGPNVRQSDFRRGRNPKPMEHSYEM